MRHTLVLISIVLNVALVALFWVAWNNGIPQLAWENDTTLITPGIISLFALTFLCVVYDTARGSKANLGVYDFVAYTMVTLGMVGTVYGFWIALSGVDANDVGDVNNIGPMVGSLIEGMGIALWTTLSGITCYLVLSANIRLMEWEMSDER